MSMRRDVRGKDYRPRQPGETSRGYIEVASRWRGDRGEGCVYHIARDKITLPLG